MHLVDGRVMIFGTFDKLHLGHEHFINSARELGQELIVVVGRDGNVRSFKSVLVHSDISRRKIIQTRFQDLKVVLGDRKNPMKVIRKYKPALICLGYDQVGFSDRLRFDFPEIEVRRLKSFFPEQYKSSKM